MFPPAAQSSTWCVWQASAGIPQPGMMQPLSRAASARRWAGVAVRAVRPTASGIRVPEQGRGQLGDPRRRGRTQGRPRPVGGRVGSRIGGSHQPAGPAAARSSATVSGQCPESTTMGVTMRVAGGEPLLGGGQGVPAGGGPHLVPQGGRVQGDRHRHRQPAAGRDRPGGVGGVDQRDQPIGAPRGGGHVVGLGAQPLGERVDRGDHRLPLQAGQDAGQDHRIGGQGERQRPGLVGGGLVGLRVRGGVQHPDHPGTNARHRQRGQLPPQRGQLLDHRGHLIGRRAGRRAGPGRPRARW